MILAVDLLACALGGYKHVPEAFLMHPIDQEKYSVLSFLIAIIEMRTDWPAWCEVIGVRSWAHGRYPCPKCDLPLSRMITANYISQITLDSAPWGKYGQEQYLADVHRSTIVTRFPFDCCYFCFHVLNITFKLASLIVPLESLL